jgi:hypothetical protein
MTADRSPRKHATDPQRRAYRRLRTLQRLGLLAPILKLQRKLEGR